MNRIPLGHLLLLATLLGGLSVEASGAAEKTSLPSNALSLPPPDASDASDGRADGEGLTSLIIPAESDVELVRRAEPVGGGLGESSLFTDEAEAAAAAGGGGISVRKAEPTGNLLTPSAPEDSKVEANQIISVSEPLGKLRPESPLLPEGPSGGSSKPKRAEEGQLPDKTWLLSVETRFVFDDNIFLTSDNPPAGARGKVSDLAAAVIPSVRYQRGDAKAKNASYVTVNYSAPISLFLENSGENSLDHNFRFDIQRRWGRFAAGLEGKYQRLSGATAELSDRVDRDELSAKARASYYLSGRTSLQAAGGYAGTRYREAGLVDYDDFLAELFAIYELTGRTKVGLGAATGTTEVKGQEQQTYQRALVRAETAATGKISLSTTGGIEWRQTATGSTTTPVLNSATTYKIGEGTNVTLQSTREVNASGALAGQNVRRSGISAKLDQRLGRRFGAGLEAGYDKLKYSQASKIEPTAATANTATRSDEYYFIRPSLRYEFQEGRRAEVYYLLREDDSSIKDFSFESNQLGLSLAFDF